MGIVALIAGLIACAALVGQACALAELRRRMEELKDDHVAFREDFARVVTLDNGLHAWHDRRLTVMEKRADLLAEAVEQQRPAHAVAWQELFGRN